MKAWVIDTERDLRLRALGRHDAEIVSQIAARAFGTAETGECVRRMLRIYLASGCADIPLERQEHTLLPVTYYILVQGEASRERGIGLTGLYRRLWEEEQEGNYWLGWFAVDPDFQGQGMGERLLRATMALCTAKGGRRLSIETAPELQSARRLYRRLGFTEAPAIPDYWKEGSDLILFHRRLDGNEFHDLLPPKGISL